MRLHVNKNKPLQDCMQTKNQSIQGFIQTKDEQKRSNMSKSRGGALEPGAPCPQEIQGKKGTFKYFLPQKWDGARAPPPSSSASEYLC